MGYTAAVLTISDKGSRGERVDTSGPMLVGKLREKNFEIVYTKIIPDERDIIKRELIKLADEKKVDLVLTTGGTGFAERDITPEATEDVIDRETPGIPELMRAESAKITNKACLSRSKAGIRKHTLIINLPGSEKAAKENFEAVAGALDHGMEMLLSKGSANCGEPVQESSYGKQLSMAQTLLKPEIQTSAEEKITKKAPEDSLVKGQIYNGKKIPPRTDLWLKEAKKDVTAPRCGMYLLHNGVVREDAKAMVRQGAKNTEDVTGMEFHYNTAKVRAAIDDAYNMDGIYYIRVWLNDGELEVGDDIMFVFIGGDIRPHVVDALQALVGTIKNSCVEEIEKYDVQSTK